jgi:hypothetical protein
MKEFVTPDVYRTIATQILPGLVASSTWIIGLHDHSEGARKFFTARPTEATACVFLAAVFWGFVCEDLGSRLEVFFYWKQKARDDDENWYAYLRTAYLAEPIGVRYIRTLLTRLKFELNSAAALVTAAVGSLCTNVSFMSVWIVFSGMILAAAYLLLEGWAGVKVLREIRAELRKPLTIVGGHQSAGGPV